MTKRVRSAARQHRPGARPPSERDLTRRRLPRPESELQAATEMADTYADASPAVTSSVADRAPSERSARAVPQSHPRHRPKPGSLLATRAADEYVYVAQDMRRIVLVAGGLVVLLFALWLLIVVMKVIELPFY